MNRKKGAVSAAGFFMNDMGHLLFASPFFPSNQNRSIHKTDLVNFLRELAYFLRRTYKAHPKVCFGGVLLAFLYKPIIFCILILLFLDDQVSCSIDVSAYQKRKFMG